MSNVPNATMVPTVHLNGTPGERLLDGYRDVLTACRELAQTLENAEPNARDFYVQGDAAIGKAMAEHNARVERIRLTMNEITSLYDAVDDQIEARKRR